MDASIYFGGGLRIWEMLCDDAPCTADGRLFETKRCLAFICLCVCVCVFVVQRGVLFVSWDWGGQRCPCGDVGIVTCRE